MQIWTEPLSLCAAVPDAIRKNAGFVVPTARSSRAARFRVFYWIAAVSELDVPTLLLAVTDKELMVSTSVFPSGGVPWNVNGTLTENCPPKAMEAFD